MIAPLVLPQSFQEWNARWGAPWRRRTFVDSLIAGTRLSAYRRGLFDYQGNNGTRRFEYPWVHQQIRRQGSRLDVVEIGGGLSGLQFVLAREGDRVTNVDPGQPGLGWGLDRATHESLCRRFAAPVRLVTQTIDAAGLQDASADVIVCVSVLEHLSDGHLNAVAEHVKRVLRPDGVMVLTVDLFLDVEPFGSAERNKWGRNVDVRRFLERAGVEVCVGRVDQLLGFEQFQPRAVLDDLAGFLLGDYPCLAQCVVARRVRECESA